MPAPAANWSYPTAIRFGPGRIAELPAACEAAGIARLLLVTDRGLASLPITVAALDLLEGAGLGRALFSDVDPNPDDVALAAGVAAFRAGGHDGVVAFGGGSGLDLGKLIAFMSGQSRPVWDFEDIGDWWTRADPAGIAPIVAVPTTAGTGSEVGRAGVLTNSETHVKKIIFHPKILPSVVICDPELTTGMPRVITVGTGLDAFAHCLEAWCSPFYHPMSAGIALEGMRLVMENLPIAAAEPGNLRARAELMSAAAMGAVAFQKGLGAIHALSHPVGAVHNTHHGMTNAVFIPTVLAYNRPAVEERISRAAAYLGIEGGFDGFMEAVIGLCADLGVPPTLTALGVSNPDLKALALMAAEDPSCGGNPMPLDAAILADLYAQAL
ncbi:MAG: iron-containing alcohol dehydrogenase [Pseudomonadota bacterium]|nr:iron-containing alcohol dehydrogenase [Pseudomonadota bacterium]